MVIFSESREGDGQFWQNLNDRGRKKYNLRQKQKDEQMIQRHARGGRPKL
jgi:hypothetical protein